MVSNQTVPNGDTPLAGRDAINRVEESNRLMSALTRLDAWIEAESFRGWDPHDALNSPFLGWAGNRQRLLGIAFVQLLRRCPVNLRPALGIAKGYNPKAMGLFLGTYAQRFMATGDERHLTKARFFSDWLLNNACPGYSGLCWGYNFDWPNRGFFAPAGTPTVVNTAFVGLSFSLAELAFGTTSKAPNVVGTGASCGQPGNGHPTPSCRSHTPPISSGSMIARSACEFILRDLHTLRPNHDEICFSYTPIDHRFVHNANLLGAWLLADVYARAKEGQLAEAALAAARFTARRQRSDGSWAYGTARHDGWVDNFHTGYVLVALKHIARCLETSEFDRVIDAGYRFWKTKMFFSGIIPKYYPERVYPIDIHSVAQSILTFLEFSALDSDARGLAEQVALWAIRSMQNAEGYFYYQLRRTFRITIPYMRWSQAWMQTALTQLLYPIYESG